MAGLGPESSMLKLTPEEEATVMKMTSTTQISDYLHDLMVQNQLCRRDYYDKNVLIPVSEEERQQSQQQQRQAAPSGKKFAKTIVYNGVEYEISADDQPGLDAAELSFFRQREQERVNGQQQQPRNADGTFRQKTDDELSAEEKAAADARTVQLSLLEDKYKMGLITLQDYIRQSGMLQDAVDEAINNRVEAEHANQQQATEATNAWQKAADEFINSSDWPGGKENERVMMEILQENNRPATTQSLREVYEFMKSENLLVDNPEADALRAVGNARTKEELDAALNHYRPNGGRSVFGV